MSYMECVLFLVVLLISCMFLAQSDVQQSHRAHILAASSCSLLQSSKKTLPPHRKEKNTPRKRQREQAPKGAPEGMPYTPSNPQWGTKQSGLSIHLIMQRPTLVTRWLLPLFHHLYAGCAESPEDIQQLLLALREKTLGGELRSKDDLLKLELSSPRLQELLFRIIRGVSFRGSCPPLTEVWLWNSPFLFSFRRAHRKVIEHLWNRETRENILLRTPQHWTPSLLLEKLQNTPISLSEDDLWVIQRIRF